QGDVSVYKNLMFMSVEMPNGRLDCGEQGFPPVAPQPGQPGGPAANKDRFRGVRIFDISDITNPKQVGAVQTCRGSHTHTLVTDPNDRENVYVYVSGSAGVRPEEELAGCTSGNMSVNPNTAQFRLEVIQVPLANPADARIVTSPRVFNDLTAPPGRGGGGGGGGAGRGGRGGRGGGAAAAGGAAGAGAGAAGAAATPPAPPEPRPGPSQCHDITVYPAV